MEHNYILHSGTKRHSGRYKWGSGENPYQHEPWFKGWGDLKPKEQSEYAKSFGMTLKEARYRYSIGTSMEKAAQIAHAKELRNTKQMSVKAIAEKMHVSESTVNTWLKPETEEKVRETERIAKKLEEFAEKHVAIDIGKGVETALGIRKTKLEAAVQLLKDKGYFNLQWDQLQQTNTKNTTHNTALVKPKPEWKNMTYAEIKKDAFKTVMSNLDDVVPPFYIFANTDNEKGLLGAEPPKSVPSSKIEVVYTQPDGTGGAERDGLIELRRGAKDLSLGGAHYAQVRIAVDGTHYIKGMAVYSDNLPEGIDIRIHSNKKSSVPLKSDDPDAKQVLKPMKRKDDGTVDMDDPFGAQIRAQKGCINIVNEEEKWGDWTSGRSLASQVLSKQRPELAKQQLNIDYLKRLSEYDEIKKIENPIVKKKRLEDFADECDRAAQDLKAAALPGQSVKVLLPIPSLKPGECYCPAYKDGEKLALIRYPHGSKAEIPIVTVNNSNKEGQKVMTNEAITAIGLNPKDAARLSGADFDGDTVVCIPNKKGYIENKPEIKSLKGFDPKESWPAYEGMKVIKHTTQQLEMGKVTNLITDMTLSGKSDDEEIARAIKASMVIIDSEKHKLNWKGAFEEYRIEDLKKKYQQKENGRYGGASTLISKATSQENVRQRNKYFKIDPNTGEKIFTETGAKRHWYVNEKTGKKYYKDLLPSHPDYNLKDKYVEQESTKMMEAKDARELMSTGKYRIEQVYAGYANQMKALGNSARKDTLSIKDTPYNPQASITYANEVRSLKEKVDSAKVNAVLERVAQRSTDVIITDRIRRYPERYNTKDPEGKKHLSKLRNQVLNQQRAVLDKRRSFDITEKEWEAIQSGALRKTLVKEVINRADADRVKELSTPKSSGLPILSKANLAHARAMLNSGFTQAQVADSFNISVSTLSRLLKGL